VAANQTWLLQEVRAEAAMNYARVFALPDELPVYLQEVTEGWPSSKKLALLTARIKSVHTSAEEPPPLLSDEELDALSSFRYPIRNWCENPFSAVSFVWSDTRIVQKIDLSKVSSARRRNEISEGVYKIDRRRLRSRVDAGLRPLFGKPDGASGSERTFWFKVGSLFLQTVVDLGARHPIQMRLSHQLWEEPWKHRVAFLRGIRGLLGAGECEWRYLTDARLEDGVSLLTRYCTDFANAVPRIMA
jgi:hypothetical protein